jgi:D-beta-D-heptose 7-phosphate kinase/D-beta-D-heptose 1-phosphate adenosyltransferase
VDPLARHPPAPSGPGERAGLEALAAALGRLELVVVGDAILDVYLRGPVGRFAREAPVPVVTVTEREEAPGGAANAALNAAALGARVRLVTAVGADPEGDRLLGLLDAGGVDVDGVVRLPARRTVSKHRVVADGHSLVRIDEGTTEALPPPAERRLLEALDGALRSTAAVLVSDYLGGVLTPAVLRALGRPRTAAGALVVADGRRLERLAAARPTVITPSYEEVALLLGEGVGAEGSERFGLVARRADRLLAATGAQCAAVTLDRDGALVVDREGTARRTVPRRRVQGPCTGAGDAFAATLALSLAAGGGPGEAAELATLAATAAVEQEGTARVTAQRLCDELGAVPSEPALVDAVGARGSLDRPLALRRVEAPATPSKRLHAP